MEKLLFIDVETTGLDEVKNDIIQLSGIIVIDGEIKSNFNYNMRPFKPSNWDSVAYKLAQDRGLSKEIINGFDDPKSVYEQFTNLLNNFVDKYNKQDKFQLAGYNVSGFDRKFLYEWFKKSGDKYPGSYFWPIPIDVMYLASNYLSPVRSQLPSFKLHSIAGFLGIETTSEELHDSDFDVQICYKIYDIVGKNKIEVTENQNMPWE